MINTNGRLLRRTRNAASWLTESQFVLCRFHMLKWYRLCTHSHWFGSFGLLRGTKRIKCIRFLFLTRYRRSICWLNHAAMIRCDEASERPIFPSEINKFINQPIRKCKLSAAKWLNVTMRWLAIALKVHLDWEVEQRTLRLSLGRMQSHHCVNGCGDFDKGGKSR